MRNKSKFVNPVAAAVGVAFVSSLAASASVIADDNPFSTADLGAGYQLAGEKGAEGSCGEKDAEGKCGEGKCGANKGAEGSCGEKGKEASGAEKGAEGSCGEKGKEGSCGGNA